MNRTFLFTIILVIVFAGVIVFLANRTGEQEVFSPQATPAPPLSRVNETLSLSPTQIVSPSPTISPWPSPIQTAITLKTVTVNITDSGFSPSEVLANAGDTVRFGNQGNQTHWPASAVHPVHELYPGSSITKCGTSEYKTIFDACRGLKTGESFSFTFNAKGSWPFHDHLNPSLKGRVIVQ